MRHLVSPLRFALLVLAVIPAASARADDPAPAGEPLHTERYDVRPILALAGEAHAPRLGLAPWEDGHGAVLRIGYDDTPWALASADELIELVEALAGEGALDVEGARAEMFANELLVVAPLRVHERIRPALAALRRLRTRTVRMEVQLATLDARRGSPPPVGPLDDAAATTFSASAQGSRRMRGRLRVHDRGVIASVRQTLLLADYEINQTGIVPVRSPVILPLGTGEALEVRPRLISADRVLLEMRFDHATLVGNPRDVRSIGGMLEAPTVDRAGVHTVATLASGVPTVVSLIRAPGDASGLLAVVVTASIDGAAPADDGPLPIRAHPTALLIREGLWLPERFAVDGPLVSSSYGYAGSSLLFVQEEELPAFSAADVAEMVVDAVREGLEDDEGLVLGTGDPLVLAERPAVHDAVAACLARHEAQQGKRVWVQALRIPAGRAAADRIEAKDIAKLVADGRVARLAEVLLLDGTAARVRTARERAYIEGTEWCSGGTAEHVESPGDPVVGTLVEGLDLHVRAHVRRDDRAAWLDLAVRDTRATAPIRPFVVDGIVHAELPSLDGRQFERGVDVPLDGTAVIVGGDDEAGYLAVTARLVP